MSIRFLLENLADTATLSSSDFLASLPATNLQVEGRGRVARTANATGTKTINGDFAAATSINCFVLSGHNLQSAGTIRLRLYASAAQGGTVRYDSGSVSPYTSGLFTGWASAMSVLYPSHTSTVLSFKLEWADATNPAGYLQAKRLLLGSYFEPASNVVFPLDLTWEDGSVQRRTHGGSIRTDVQARYRRLVGTMGRLTEAERASFFDLVRPVGIQKEIFCSVFPGATGQQERDYALVGKFTRTPRFTHPEYGNHRCAFEIEET